MPQRPANDARLGYPVTMSSSYRSYVRTEGIVGRRVDISSTAPLGLGGQLATKRLRFEVREFLPAGAFRSAAILQQKVRRRVVVRVGDLAPTRAACYEQRGGERISRGR